MTRPPAAVVRPIVTGSAVRRIMGRVRSVLASVVVVVRVAILTRFVGLTGEIGELGRCLFCDFWAGYLGG